MHRPSSGCFYMKCLDHCSLNSSFVGLIRKPVVDDDELFPLCRTTYSGAKILEMSRSGALQNQLCCAEIKAIKTVLKILCPLHCLPVSKDCC